MSNTQEGICKYANSGTVDLLLAPARKHIAVVVLTLGRKSVEVCHGYTFCLCVK